MEHSTMNSRPPWQGAEPVCDGHVRPVVAQDIGAIASLQEKLLGRGNATASPARRQALQAVILDNPWRNNAIPSLVYEQSDGRVTGFLGVVPRPMRFRGRRILASISHTFVVEPESRSRLAALKLIQTYLSGPQDVSIAEGNQASRRIWEGLGGSVPLLYSLGWMRILQPGQFFTSVLQRRNLSPLLSSTLNRVSRLLDSTAPARSGPFRLSEPVLQAEPLDAAMLSQHMAAFCQDRDLYPDYEENSLDWLLGLLARKASDGGVRKVLLRDSRQRIAGWYIYALTATGTWKVIQIMAARGLEGEVLDHLFYQARNDGAVALYGFMDTRLFAALSARECVFRHDGKSTWMLAASRDPHILQAFHEGRAVVSRLDAEWWISFLIE